VTDAVLRTLAIQKFGDVAACREAHLPNERWYPVRLDDPQWMLCASYEVSSFGRVRRVPDGVIRTGPKLVNGILGQAPLGKHGRLAVSFRFDSFSRRELVHRLVLFAIKGPPPDHHPMEGRYEGSHLDGDFTNNFSYNLAWETHPQNEARKNGRITLTSDIVREIKSGLVSYTIPEMADRYGVHVETIRQIKRGTNWRHVPWPLGFDANAILDGRTRPRR